MKTLKIAVLTLSIFFASCNSLFVNEKNTTENQITAKNINVEVKANEVNVVNLKFDNFAASFRVEYTKTGIEPNRDFNVSMTNNLVNNKQILIDFSGNGQNIKKYIVDQEVDNMSFTETGYVFLNGKSSADYNTTFVNSFPFNESSYALFKIFNMSTKEEIYGWLNFTITTDTITFHKMVYSNEILTEIND